MTIFVPLLMELAFRHKARKIKNYPEHLKHYYRFVLVIMEEFDRQKKEPEIVSIEGMDEDSSDADPSENSFDSSSSSASSVSQSEGEERNLTGLKAQDVQSDAESVSLIHSGHDESPDRENNRNYTDNNSSGHTEVIAHLTIDIRALNSSSSLTSPSQSPPSSVEQQNNNA